MGGHLGNAPAWRGAELTGRGRALAALAAAALASLLDAAEAGAHMRTATFSTVTVGGDPAGRQVEWSVRVRLRDLEGPDVGLGLAPGTARELDATHAQDFFARRLRVTERGAPCPRVRGGAVKPDPNGGGLAVVVHLLFACARPPRSLVLGYDLLFDADPLHTGYASVAAAGEPAVTVIFRAGAREASVDVARSAWRSAAAYLQLGVEHIFTGYDHLAFLAALLLASGLRRRSGGGLGPEPAGRRAAIAGALQLVTAFTVAHSLTLIVATLRPGLVPTSWVEPAIALSIAYVAVENVVRAAPPRRRWPLVFAFGLVHGLGFSSVLREIGLPPRGLVLSLLAFNVGVELGQFTVVALFLPLVLLAARRRPAAFERWGLRAGSAALALAGAVWFVLRLRS